MSPRLTFTLTLLGVLAAGIPLACLTGKRRQAPAAPAAQAVQPAGVETVYAELNYSGAPAALQIMHGGRVLATMPAGTPAPWGCDLELPAGAAALELQVQAEWPAPGNHGITLQLEPPARPAAADTQWSGPDSTTLHAIFSFKW